MRCHYLRQIYFGNFLSGLLQVDKWILHIRNICSEAARLISHFPGKEAVWGGFGSSPSYCPCKNDVFEGTMTSATCLCHLSLCDTAHFSVSGLGTMLLPGLALTATSQICQRWESNLNWPEQDFQPLGQHPAPGFKSTKTSTLPAIHQHRANYLRPIQAEGKQKHPSMGLFNTHLWSGGSSSWSVQVIYSISV